MRQKVKINYFLEMKLKLFKNKIEINCSVNNKYILKKKKNNK